MNSSSTNECSSDDDHGLIQTEVSNIVINEGDDYIMKSPGENVEIKLRATDEQNISTIAFLQISIDDDDQSDVLVVSAQCAFQCYQYCACTILIVLNTNLTVAICVAGKFRFGRM